MFRSRLGQDEVDRAARGEGDAVVREKPGHDLGVPAKIRVDCVPVIAPGGACRRGQERQVVGRRVERAGEFAKRGAERVGKLFHLLVAQPVEIGALPLRINRHLERRARRIRAEDREAVVFINQPRTHAHFLAQDVVKNRASLALVKIARDKEFLFQRGRHDAHDHQLAHRVRHMRASQGADIFHDEKGTQARIVHQVEHPFFPRLHHQFHVRQRERFERLGAGRFDNDLVRAEAVGVIVKSVGGDAGPAFDAQGGRAVRDDAHQPVIRRWRGVKRVRRKRLPSAREGAVRGFFEAGGCRRHLARARKNGPRLTERIKSKVVHERAGIINGQRRFGFTDSGVGAGLLPTGLSFES